MDVHRGVRPNAHETKDSLTLGSLIREAGPTFAKDQRLTPHQSKVIARLGLCQTSRLGGHVWACDHCGVQIPMYNSCRNRHCPQCQAGARFKWVAARTRELLPTPYFHVVFTLPHPLNPYIQQHPQALLNLLFQAASSTLLTFAKDPQYLGATPGVLMVLHTWRRQAASGLSASGAASVGVRDWGWRQGGMASGSGVRDS